MSGCSREVPLALLNELLVGKVLLRGIAEGFVESLIFLF